MATPDDSESPANRVATTASAPGWVSTRHLQHMVARGEAAGIAVDEILASAGINKAMLTDADAPVPLAAVETMLDTLSRRYADPLLGLHLAGDIQPATFGVIGHIAQACNTLADVIDAALRFHDLLSNISRLAVVHRPGVVDVQWECISGGPAFRRHATEYVLGAFVTLARLLVPEHAQLVRSVSFAHARPNDAARLREYVAFFRAPVQFGATQSMLTIPVVAAGTRLRHGDAFLKDLLEQHAREQRRQRAQISSLRDDVKRLTEAMLLDGVPEKDAVAQQLGMSARSLHRKLQEEGSSFTSILADVRAQIAHRLLAEDLPVARVAEATGFSTPQAFLRWFRQHNGMTPGEFRAQARRRPPDAISARD